MTAAADAPRQGTIGKSTLIKMLLAGRERWEPTTMAPANADWRGDATPPFLVSSCEARGYGEVGEALGVGLRAASGSRPLVNPLDISRRPQ